MTFAELEARANRLAHHLAAHGVDPAPRRAGGSDSVPLVVTFPRRLQAARRTGERQLPLHRRRDDGALRRQRRRGPGPRRRPRRRVRPGPGRPRQSPASGRDRQRRRPARRPRRHLCAALASSSSARDFPPRSADDIHILYTGGTTGRPKGVVWRHEDTYPSSRPAAPGPTPPSRRPPEPRHGTDPCRCPPDRSCTPRRNGLLIAALHRRPRHRRDRRPLRPGCRMGRVRPPGRPVPRRSTATPWPGPCSTPSHRPAGPGQPDRPCTPVEASCHRRSRPGSPGCCPTPSSSTPSARPKPAPSCFSPAAIASPGAARRRHQAGLPDTIVVDDTGTPVPPGATGLIAKTGHIPLRYHNDPREDRPDLPHLRGEALRHPGRRSPPRGRRHHHRARPPVQLHQHRRREGLPGRGRRRPHHPSRRPGLPRRRRTRRPVGTTSLRPPAPRPGHTITLDDLQTHARAALAGYKIPRSLRLVERIERHPTGQGRCPLGQNSVLTAANETTRSNGPAPGTGN